ncbi:hypothetical protein GCM10009534_30890 [Kribbella sandramycini]|uniref:Glycosyl transferase family 2 n=1 Tax=Kribbella sandramycini TaxID=60450 RepID=A0A841SCQ3_9ACTN|nr:hypothetical protein [Kribbella sandramycini]
MSHPIKHVPSHASLLRDVSTVRSTSANSRLDAIVVPAARSSLQRLIELSAQLSVPLVVLCSRQAQADKVAARVEDTFGAQALVVDVPDDYTLPGHQPRTSDEIFRTVSCGRSSDLSVKRNLGLLLARLRGWRKILFVDDDIYQLRPLDVSRLAASLDRYPVASMASRYFPDNSVVCHARRLAGLQQDIFVSGAVLGVNTQHPALSFFPDIYNEDWFFFAQHAAARALPKIGEVRQDEYRPFEDPERAGREELGDVLAEGLYALFSSTPGWSLAEQLEAATGPRHWQYFLEDRQAMISTTRDRLARLSADDALQSLAQATEQLSLISPELCVDFIEKWRADDASWQRLLPAAGTACSEREAMETLGLSTWYAAGYDSGAGSVESWLALSASLSRSSTRRGAPGRGWRSPVDSNPSRS